jgi:hypothetical protein
MASQSMKQDCPGRVLTAATIRGNVVAHQDAEAVVLDLEIKKPSRRTGAIG